MRLVLILIPIVLLSSASCSSKRKSPSFFYGAWLDTTGTFSNKIIFFENGDFLFSERDSSSLRVKYNLELEKDPIELTVSLDSTREKKKATIEIINDNRIYLRLLDENDNVVDSIYMQREQAKILSK